MPIPGGPINSGDSFAQHSGSRVSGFLQQQTIERHPGEDCDWPVELECDLAARGSDQFAIADPVALNRRVCEKRPARESFVRQPTAAWLFPSQLFVKEKDFTSRAGQFGSGKGTCGAATYDRNSLRNHGSEREEPLVSI